MSLLFVDSEYLLLIENSEIRLLLLVGVATFDTGLLGFSTTGSGSGSTGISIAGHSSKRSDLFLL